MVEPDGTFLLEGLIGENRISTAAPKGWMVKSIACGNRDITDLPLDVGELGRADRLHVVLTNRMTSVAGTVVDDSGRVVTDYQVLVFPQDPDRVRRAHRTLRHAGPDQQAVFRIEALPPGDYFAVALTEVEEDSRFAPEFLERVRGAATPFALREGDQQQLRLSLTLLP